MIWFGKRKGRHLKIFKKKIFQKKSKKKFSKKIFKKILVLEK